jgi:hypothetical protein
MLLEGKMDSFSIIQALNLVLILQVWLQKLLFHEERQSTYQENQTWLNCSAVGLHSLKE